MPSPRVDAFDLIDDDGVLVISTRKNLIRVCPPAFDYVFPGVLLGAMRAGLAVTWRTWMEGTSEITLRRFDARVAGEAPVRLGYLSVPDDDELVVLPWSALTYAFDVGRGQLKADGRLAVALAQAPGWYDVRCAPPAHDADHPRGVDLSWSIDLVSLDGPPSPDALGELDVVAFDED